MLRKFAVQLISVLSALLCSCHAPPSAAKTTPPTLILWAWDRAEDLRFLKPGQAEVAGLLATFQFHNGQMSEGRRRLPLFVPPDVPLTAVVRLESDGSALPTVDDVAMSIRSIATREMGRLQIDFDARRTQWDWYSSLLHKVKSEPVPSFVQPRDGFTMPDLSITALASWCLDRPWFTGEQSDLSEAVPMLFRMGPQRFEVLDRLARQRKFAPQCSDAVGVSLDEPLPWHPPAKRIYIFNPKRWTKEAFDQACARWR